MRTYPSKTGWTCADVGQTDGTTFGRVDSGDEIHPLELPELGSCADVTKDKFALWVNNYPANAGRQARAVVFGAVAPEVDRVSVTTDGTRKELPVTRGAFIDALPASSLAARS